MAASGGSWTKWIIALYSWIYTVFLLSEGLEIHHASQCFKSRGIPKVSFDCPSGYMVKIHKAFHGIAVQDRNEFDADEMCSFSPDQPNNNCTQCVGDCIDDSMNLVYDWSTCMGNTTCTRTVMQSYMPTCNGRDKFSDYLQVEYQCIPRNDVIDICSKMEITTNEGYIMSPNYPYNYPVNQDCHCKIHTDWSSRIQLSMYDLLLETKNGRCRADWLMLRQKDQKHRHCGAIMTGVKNITSETNSLGIQFHSDENDNRTQNFQYFTRSLKGFWLYFKAQPTASVRVACRRLTREDNEVREIKRDDDEYDKTMSTKHVDTTPNPSEKDNKLKDKMKNKENEVDNKKEGNKHRNRFRQNGKNHFGKGGEANYQEGGGRRNSGHQLGKTSALWLSILSFLIMLHL